jgi:hypothetical protein
MRVSLRLSHRGKNTDSVCVREHGAAEICKMRSFTNINLRQCYGDKIKKGDMGEINVYKILVKKRKWEGPLGLHRSEGRVSFILKWIVQTRNTKVFNYLQTKPGGGLLRVPLIYLLPLMWGK